MIWNTRVVKEMLSVPVKQFFFSDEVSSVMASERDLMALANESETWEQSKLKGCTVILSPWLILL